MEPLRLVPFEADYAEAIVPWVRSDAELRWLAPSTRPPLTAEKVLAWHKPHGRAFLGFAGDADEPIAYGEINPMRYDAGHFWLGHVIVDPGRRRQGLGRQFVRRLLDEAFARAAARRVSLVVFPDNAPAIRCYKDVGFALVGEEHHRFLDGEPFVRLLRYEASLAPRNGGSACLPLAARGS